jgi:hypothetical protein
MRWDNLFDDLESQLERELDAEEGDLLAEEERLRLSRLTVRDRVIAMTRPGESRSEQLMLALRDGTIVTVAVGSVGRDWIVGELIGARRGSCVVPLTAVSGILPTAEQLVRSITAEQNAEPPVSLSARLGLGFVLRDLCRRRAAVELSTASAKQVHGTIDRVGRDHLDLAEHEAGLPRRAAAVSRLRVLPFDELLLVRF